MLPIAHTPLKVFCAYARENLVECNRLKAHLTVLVKENLIRFWCDQEIRPGNEWEREITQNLKEADIILLLISSAFIASEYCYKVEMHDALALHEADKNNVRVIPIIIYPCHWKRTPLRQLQALPANGEAIFRHGNDAESALAVVTEEIDRVASEILEQRARRHASIMQFPPPDEEDTVNAPILDEEDTVNATPPEIALAIDGEIDQNEERPGAQSTSSQSPQITTNPPVSTQTGNVINTGNGGVTPPKKSLFSLMAQKPRLTASISLALIFSIIGGIVFGVISCSNAPLKVNIVDLHYTHATPIASDSNTVTVGVSDGNYAFDTQDAPSKAEAAQAFAAGKNAPSWNTLFTNKSLKDGESCIYAQDQTVTGPYFTVVAAVTLSRPTSDLSLSAGAGEEELQGICLKQIYYNNNGQTSSPEMKMRVIVANIGARALTLPQTDTNQVVDQIKQIASDPHNNFMGVIGLPFSTTVSTYMPLLNAAQIPVISPSASSAQFASGWSYFHRAVSDTTAEGQYAAQFALDLLQSKNITAPKVLVFQASDDSNELYSTKLGEGFTSAFGEPTPETRPYTTSANDPFSNVNQSINNYDLVFCACFSNEFADLHKYLTEYHYKGIIMGGEALYDLEGYPQNSQTVATPTPDQSYRKIYFTSFAYPDEIHSFCRNTKISACSPSGELGTFYQRYCQAFAVYDPKYSENPKNQGRACPGRPESHLTLAYDATSALLKAYSNAVLHVYSSAQQSTFQQTVPLDKKMNPDNVDFQGITGHIQFNTETSSNAVKKVILALCVDSGGYTQFLSYSNMNFFQDNQQSPQPPPLDTQSLNVCN